MLAVRVARDLLADGLPVVGHRAGKAPCRCDAVGERRGDGRGAVFLLKFGPEACGLEGHRTVVCNADTTLFAARLGGDEHHAVLAHRTVKRGCGGALEDGDVLDVVGVEVGDRVTEVHRGVAVGIVGARTGGYRAVAHRDTVDDEQRFVGAVVERRVAAQRHTYRTAGAGARRGHRHTGDLAVEPRHPVARYGFGEFVARDFRNGIADRFLRAGQAECRDDHFVDLLRRFFQRDVDRGAASDRDLLRVITQRLEDQHVVVAAHMDRIGSVCVRNRACRSPLQDDGGPDERAFAVRVEHDARDVAALGPGGRSDQQHYRGCQSIPYVCFKLHIVDFFNSGFFVERLRSSCGRPQPSRSV